MHRFPQSSYQNTCPWICTQGTQLVVDVSMMLISRSALVARTLDVSVHSSFTTSAPGVGSKILSVDIVSFTQSRIV